jgi:outer membrane protein OmpA-like peptidoglycan-associated protein
MKSKSNVIRNLGISAILFSALALPQNPPLTNIVDGRPVFRVDVVARTIKAINFHHRQGSTQVALLPSPLLKAGKGEAKVDSKPGATKIDAIFEGMRPAADFGEGFLTYVMWAITPEGRPQNLGEVMLNGNRARLQAATELQSFGLLVTAEPYYAVSQPSDMVVLEGAVKDGKTTGTIMPVDIKYELLRRGEYVTHLPPADRIRWYSDKKTPLDLLEARHAMAIARSVGAERLAPDVIAKANVDLGNAEAFLRSGGDVKKIQSLARHVTQLAEDARLLAMEKSRAEFEAAERRAAAERERKLEADRQAQLAARRQAEQVAKDAENAAARAEREKQRMAAEAEQKRLQAETAKLEKERAAREAEHARQMAEASKREAESAQREAARAKQEAQRLREQLRAQLTAIFETRESARGLILNMSDVHFDTAKYSLLPGAREKLAKVAGIILAHPGLKIEIEGHTDSVGSDEYNQRLSEQRAESVRSYLTGQGLTGVIIASRGFGESRPVASNDTPEGRRANRRVELVVSGAFLTETQGILSYSPAH